MTVAPSPFAKQPWTTKQAQLLAYDEQQPSLPPPAARLPVVLPSPPSPSRPLQLPHVEPSPSTTASRRPPPHPNDTAQHQPMTPSAAASPAAAAAAPHDHPRLPPASPPQSKWPASALSFSTLTNSPCDLQ
uniref:Vegetative cell wall protein gp1-like n=1 Tax=Nicotiana tabacum TaxID=4097 RepID=A0A1S3XJ00_TOBAC|nr:PREDICTED: vegetative cell wall protein gp1-like [Nicotiana tabacum]